MKKHFKELLLLLTATLLVLQVNAAEIWVSPTGSDTNTGTKSTPLASVGMALRKARNLRRLGDPAVEKGIFIFLKGGVYHLYEPLFIRPEDSGTASSLTIIKAAPGENPIISGGIRINGWTKNTRHIAGLRQQAQGKVWEADAPLVADNILDFRQLYVNNLKSLRSRDTQVGLMNRILSWNHKEETCWIPKPTVDISNVKGLELFIHQWWAIAVLRVKSVEISGDSAKLSFLQPESRIQSEHPWPAPWLSKETGNSAFYLTNAVQFLNEPGEWYLDKRNQKIYYWPRDNEDLNSANVVVPTIETLVKMLGTIDRPVSYVSFIGVSFQHTTWLRPSQKGHVPHQTGLYMLDGYKLEVPGTPDKKTLENQAWVGRPPAAVEVSFAHHTTFEGCRFEHLGSSGLDYERATHDDVIRGNLFKDISGTGIHIGLYADEGQEIHFPYNPQDERDVCTNVLVSNNLITDVTNEDWGTIGISAGYVKGINIEHNDISELSYMGIAMGWGWSKTLNTMRNNTISANKIHRYAKHMYDVSSIYTQSPQPGSLIAGNYIDSIYKAPYAHDPNHWFYLYTDEGSSFFTIKDNWTRSDKYLRNANGPGNVWDNNGSWVADSIRLAAGLKGPYKYLLKEIVPISANWEINHSERTKVIELIGEIGQKHNKRELLAIGKKYGLAAKDIYQWKNHSVFYGNIENPNLIREDLLRRFKDAYVKIYNDPFYEFQSAVQCQAATNVADCDNVILTANLAQDSLLQTAYLSQQTSQFEKWPEVSNGYCNAGFQQVFLFKNAGQLMWVIRIPKGANFKKLIKIAESNSKVIEWNQLMKRYYRSLTDSTPAASWVTLEPLRPEN